MAGSTDRDDGKGPLDAPSGAPAAVSTVGPREETTGSRSVPPAAAPVDLAPSNRATKVVNASAVPTTPSAETSAARVESTRAPSNQELTRRVMQQQLAAQQQAEYMRTLELVRHRQALQEQQLYLQQQAQLEAASAAAASAAVGGSESPNPVVMQHVQKRLQERIQIKNHQQLLYEHARWQQQHEEALNQHYHAKLRELERQANVTGSGDEQERLRQEALQRIQQLQLHKLQQQRLQLERHVAATHPANALRVTLTGVPAADPLRQQQQQQQQLRLEQEQLRVLQQQQQQLLFAGEDRAALDARLIQQQQEILRLQKQQQATLKCANSPDKHGSPGRVAATTAASGAANTTTAITASAGTPVNPPPNKRPAAASSESLTDSASKKKRKTKTPAESQMETLVRLLCRMQLARTETEFRTSLDKTLAWIVKCFDRCLLRFAQRDLTTLLPVKKEQFANGKYMAVELDPKCSIIMNKLREMIAASEKVTSKEEATSHNKETPPTKPPSREAAKALAAASTGAVGTDGQATSGIETSDSIRLEAREHAYSALKEQTLTKMRQQAAEKAKARNDASEAKAKKRQLTVDVTMTSGDVKTAGASSRTTQNAGTTSASPSSVDQKPLSTPTPPAATKMISPRIAQHLFDLDLSTRSCTVGPDEGEERFYFPVKSITKVMRKVLPGGNGPQRERRRRHRKTDHEDNADRAEAAAVKTEDKEDDDPDEDDDGAEGGDDPGDGQKDDDDAEDDAGNNGASRPLEHRRSGAMSADLAALLHPDGPVKIDEGAATLVQECVTEFLLFLTSEARDHSTLEKKKATLTGTHVVQGLQNLGFAAYAKVLSGYNDKVRKIQDEVAQRKLERKLAKQQQKQQGQRQAGAEDASGSTVQAHGAAVATTSTPMTKQTTNDTTAAIGGGGGGDGADVVAIVGSAPSRHQQEATPPLPSSS